MKTAASIVAIATMALASPALAKHHENEGMEETTAPTEAEARQIVAETEQKLFDYSVNAGRVYWINSNFITDDTDALAAQVGAEGTTLSVQAAI